MRSLRIAFVLFLVITFTVPPLAFADTWNEPIAKEKRFAVLASYHNAAVLDNETRLVWEQSPSTATYDWVDAQLHCNSATVGNRMGWRLPTLQELTSLIDPTQSNPSLPGGHPFSNVGPYVYWSATSSIPSTGNPPWSVTFEDNGRVLTGAGTGTGATVVWCVRGGQGVDPQ
jgi:hypothetical protein